MLLVVSFKCVVKCYQDCHFDAKESEDFKVLKKKARKTVLFEEYCPIETPVTFCSGYIS